MKPTRIRYKKNDKGYISSKYPYHNSLYQIKISLDGKLIIVDLSKDEIVHSSFECNIRAAQRIAKRSLENLGVKFFSEVRVSEDQKFLKE